MKKVFVLFLSVLISIASVFLLASCSSYKSLPENATLEEALKDENYSLVFEDNFDGSTLDYTKWKAGYNTPVRRAGYYEDTSDTLFVKDGNLTIRTLYKDGQYGEGWYTSWVESATNPSKGHAPINSDNYQGFSAKYGYFEIRCIVPPSEGIWSAFWLMPDESTGMSADDVQGTGSDGVEIDIMESPWMFNKSQQNLNVHVVHGDGYANTKSQKSDSYIIPDMYTSFHTYGVMWTDKEYIFYVDGKETWRTSHTVDNETLGVSQVKEYMLLTVEVAGYQDENGTIHTGKELLSDGTEAGYWCGNPDNNDKSKHYDFIIDYVKVYQKSA